MLRMIIRSIVEAARGLDNAKAHRAQRYERSGAAPGWALPSSSLASLFIELDRGCFSALIRATKSQVIAPSPFRAAAVVAGAYGLAPAVQELRLSILHRSRMVSLRQMSP